MLEWITFTGVVALGVAVITATAKFFRWSGQVDSDRSSFKKFMEEVRSDVKDILKRTPVPPIVSNSPRRLTEFGEEIARNANAYEWADAAAADLFDRVDGKERYEIEDFCFKHVRSQMDQPLGKRMAKCAYDFGIEIEGVESVVAIVSRDRLINQLFG